MNQERNRWWERDPVISGEILLVDPASDNAYHTIGEALERIPDHNQSRVCICIAPGIYRENLSVTKPNLVMKGAGREETVITGNLGAYEILEDGIKRGTFRTQTVFLHADDVAICDLTIENTAGAGRVAGQAVALYADGDRLLFENVRLSGNQDTLFTGPLPEKEVEPGGFRGPLEHAPRLNGRQCYKGCRIEGNIDFIFGSATAFFENCEIFCRYPEDPGNTGEKQRIVSYITAASTPEGQRYGYVFHRCRLTSDCPKNSCMLGRPWRDYAKTVFLECEMEDHICPEGWDDWGKEAARRECFFAECESSGSGACRKNRASFARFLEPSEAAFYEKEKVLGELR